jgi:hypothetical protein
VNRGGEFYRLGFFVSDFGFQMGTNTATFALNTTNGLEQIASTVTSNATAITVTGTYSGIAITRVYTLVAGTDVLRTTTTLTNTTGGAVDLRYFDTADPDHGGTSSTTNDVYNLPTGAGNARVAQAIGFFDNRTVIAGTLDSQGVVGFLDGASGGLGIQSGANLNAFFSNPIDPNGTLQDVGFAVALGTNIAAGASRTFVYDQSFGLTRNEAQLDFEIANVPRPAPQDPGRRRVTPTRSATREATAGCGGLALARRGIAVAPRAPHALIVHPARPPRLSSLRGHRLARPAPARHRHFAS